MAVFAAFKDGWRALSKNPSLLVAGSLVAVVGQLSTLGELTEVPVLSGLATLGWVLAFPFVLGGFVGMALAAVRERETSLGEFVRAGRANYVRLLAATLLLVGLVFVVVTATMSLGFVVVVALMMVGGLDGPAMFEVGSVLLIAGLGLTLAAVLVALTFLQFYDAAIVVEDRGVGEAFSRSVGVVRANLRSVVGFSVLWLVLLNTVLAPEYLVRAVLTGAGPPELLAVAPDVPLAVLLPVAVALTAVAFAYLYTVYTAYYVRLAAATPDGTDGADGTDHANGTGRAGGADAPDAADASDATERPMAG